MLTRFLLLLLFPVHCLLGSIPEQEGELWKEGPLPEWVVPVAFPKGVEEDAIHLQFLLVDMQESFPEKTEYYHVAAKVITQTGVEAIGQFEINFDPSFQKLVVHDIKVLRDDVWLDKMSSRSELLHREQGLDDRLFDGDLTVVYFLEDIRPGDVVEYSYSRMGANPLFAAHYFDRMDLQGNFVINQISHRLVTYPEHDFIVKQFNTSIEPMVRDLSNSLREWVWTVSDPEPSSGEEFQPEWFHSHAYIEVSDYHSWGEVAALITPLFAIPNHFESSVPEDMAELVGSWEGSSLDRALAALRFVQDQVRYLGFEEGIMGHMPHDPLLVFQRRFGDCKDKTFLLHSLLHLMGISSTPVLVHASEGKTIPDMLPTPYAFNHIILRITIEGTDYWVDPTMNLQGGSLETNFFPSYYWGLPLTVGTESLAPLPSCHLEKATQIETHVKIISEDAAEMSTEWVAYGLKADGYRQYVQQVGLSVLADEALNTLQKKYGGVSVKTPMHVEDDRENDVFRLTESYMIPLRKRGNHSILNVSSVVIRRFLDSYFNPNRTAPYSIIYPLWVKEHIHIDNSYGHWTEEEEESHFELGSIYYNYNASVDLHQADFYHELKHLDDHIPASSVKEYWEATQEIETNGSLDFKVN